MKKRKILIMSASIGAGHVKAAEAIRRELVLRYPEDSVRILDFMDRRISFFHWLLKKLYLFMLDFVPNLYDVFYHAAGGASGGTFARQISAIVMYYPMSRLIRHNQPDLLICTHPFPEGAAALWKRIHGVKLPLAAVLTDYSLHQIWIYRQVDMFFTATEDMRDGLIRMGFSPESVHACGIPIVPLKFDIDERIALRKTMGIREGVHVLLLMGGGLGIGGIEETLDELETMKPPMIILVVAGRNEKLRSRVEKQAAASVHEIRVWGYTQDIPHLMQVSDLLITKPGALTISEAFCMGLPMLLHEPIPGPETENALYAEQHGAAVWVHRGESLREKLKSILENPDQLRQMRTSALHCGRPEAVRKIAEQISLY